MIYLDNAATSFFKPENTIKAIVEYLRCPGNPDRGVNEASVHSSSLLLDARISTAKFFGFDKFTNVIFTSGDTESLNIAINGCLDSKDHVITTYFEHNSVLRPLYKKGCEISFTDGSIEQIKQSVKKNTKAVVVSHASNVTGRVLDVEKIGVFCRDAHLLFVVDSAQSAGVIPIDVNKSGIDILCFSGHKGLLGMQGVGGLIVNTEKYIEPLKVGGTGVKSFLKTQPDEYPHHLEAGTLNVPGIISLYEGIKYINSVGLDYIYNHELNLKNIFLDYLKTKKK